MTAEEKRKQAGEESAMKAIRKIEGYMAYWRVNNALLAGELELMLKDFQKVLGQNWPAAAETVLAILGKMKEVNLVPGIGDGARERLYADHFPEGEDSEAIKYFYKQELAFLQGKDLATRIVAIVYAGMLPDYNILKYWLARILRLLRYAREKSS